MFGIPPVYSYSLIIQSEKGLLKALLVIVNQDPQSLGVTGDESHDGPERGPVDRDGARSTKSKQ